MATVTSSSFGDFQAYMTYSTSSTNTTYTVSVTAAGLKQNCVWSNYAWSTTISATSHSATTGSIGVTRIDKTPPSYTSFTSKTCSWTRKTSAYTVTVSATTKNTSTGKSGTASASFTVPALASYTVSYNANGGSGAPGNQTKYYGQSFTLSSTKPTRTGYTFQGWGTSASDTSVDYAAGASYTGNAGITLYAIWKANTYTVTFNANGGVNGSVTSKTKTYDAAMTLPTAAQSPTRTYYKFLGWSTSASATEPTWTAGASYTTNITAGVTLYAVWKEDYIPPKITKFTAHRTDSNGVDNDEGTYAVAMFTWTAGTMTGVAVTPSSIIVECSVHAADSWKTVYTVSNYASNNITTTPFRNGSTNLVAEEQYDIRVTVTDQHGAASSTTFISKTAFVIDVNEDGTGIGIGTASSRQGLEIGMRTLIYGTKDASGTEESGQLIIGDPDGLHLAFDNNEFMAKSNATTPGNISINYDGGNVGLGGPDSRIALNGNCYMKNGKAIFGTNTSGAERSLVQLNASNQMFFGYGGYANSEGESYFDGNVVNIRSKGNINVTCPGDLKINGNTLADYPIEEGKSGNWFYRKMASGKAECWCWQDKSVSSWTAWGYLLYANIASISYPFSFASAPAQLVTLTSQAGSGWGAGYNNTNQATGTIQVTRNNTNPGALPFRVHIHLYGELP